MKNKNLVLILICVAIVGISLLFGAGKDFGGADSKAEEAINVINSEYEPWFESIWEPPSGETESLLFSLQAAAGAGFIGYYIGRKKSVQNNSNVRQGQ